MNYTNLTQQLDAMHLRLTQLFIKANQSPNIPNDLATEAFKELGFASEELQVANEELWLKNIELEKAYQSECAAKSRYQSIFEHSSDAYVITNSVGKIEEANSAAAELFKISSAFLKGKFLSLFIHPDDRIVFHGTTHKLLHPDRQKREWQIRFRARQGEMFHAAVTIISLNDCPDISSDVLWQICDITEHKRAEVALTPNTYTLDRERPLYVYAKGELISLNLQSIWIVCDGLVKLTTFCEGNEEMLVGLAGVSMPFGPALTALSTYQATALSDTKLVSIPLEELASVAAFNQTFFTQVNRRLQQTEALLANFGRRSVKDRLYCLLLLLKQDVGEKIARGTRLNVRLTHLDLANACGTSRVTVTRLLNNLKQENKIAFDAHRHIIVMD